MGNLEINKKYIYNLASEIIIKERGISGQKAIVKAIIKCVEETNPIETLGDAYLDYINYKEKFYDREFHEFDSYFELVYVKARKILPPERKRILEEILISKREFMIDLVIGSRIAKDYGFYEKNIEKYNLLNKIKNDND